MAFRNYLHSNYSVALMTEAFIVKHFAASVAETLTQAGEVRGC